MGDTIVPTFCFDSRIFGDQARTKFGSLKCGPRRAKFILESVADLRRQLQDKGSSGTGSGLAIYCGTTPDQVFDTVLQQLSSDSSTGIGVCTIVCQKEVLKEEKDAVQAVRSVLKKHSPKDKVHEIWGSTMYDLAELPFDVDANLADMPDGFTPFRNKVEKNCHIQQPLETPKKLSLPAADSAEYKIMATSLSFMPTLKDLGYTEEQIASVEKLDPRGVMEFRGGETAGLERVKDYIWNKDLLRVYFDTRNGMIGGDYSSKFSPWLAHGCISPRQVASECKRYEEQVVANKSTYWLVFEMLWRDFSKFFCLKHGDSVFFVGGTVGNDKKWSTFEKNLVAWKEGRTGYPLVDANMREMAATGFMSNRGRQNVCSFLAIDLNHDWRLGKYITCMHACIYETLICCDVVCRYHCVPNSALWYSVQEPIGSRASFLITTSTRIGL
jgi:deoxyribodipyrimidine photo-lyase